MKLYLQNWYEKLLNELPNTNSFRVISPFVKEQIVRTIAEQFNFENFELITRYNLSDFACNASSLDSLQYAVERGAKVYGIRQLHSKVYLFDKRAAVITSANLTSGGLINNYECGIYTTDPDVIEQLHNYADGLKRIAGRPLTLQQCEHWQSELATKSEIYNTYFPSLPDYGATTHRIDSSRNYYVKFFGEGSNRVGFDFPVKEEIDRALCHYACCFSKTPKQFNSGDIIYMGRMTWPSDYAIFGKAEAIRHVPGRDEASDEEMEQRDWKETWPLYIRVKNAQFLDGVMGNCPLLYELIRTLDYQSFKSTQRRYAEGERDINPFRSLSRQAYVKLTHEGAQWIEERFQSAIQLCGQVEKSFLNALPISLVDTSTLK